MGGEYRLLRDNGFSYGNVAPALSFSTNWTRGPLDNSPASPIGQVLASLLVGLPTSGSVSVNASNALNHVQYSDPNTTTTSTAFGVVSAERGHGRRQLNLVLKALF